MDDFTVKVAYKNKNLKNVSTRTYGLQQYAEIIKLELMRVIMDVEDAFYVLLGSKAKEDWNEEAMTRFQKIRHKLLDQANAVERLPQNLYFQEHSCAEKSLSQIIAEMLNEADKK